MSSELLASAENTLKGNLGGAWDILSGYADAYTDLGIGKQFGGAAAAYSLRDVGAMNGPVVRVRRDSDNSEQDFPARAVTEIPDWCNQSVIKPLDVRELNSGGSGDRDGNFVIAKAAYSLRSLGDRQATIANNAAPLNADTVVPDNGKYVVQVRRSSDDTIKSFTADEVTDGTLVTFVNENQVHYATDYSSGLDGWEIATNNWTGSASWSHNGTNDNRLAVTATATPSGAKRPALKLTRPSNILVGQQYSLELDYEVISGTPVLLGNNFDGADYSHNETLSGSGTATIAPAAFNAGTPFIYFDGENHTFELSIKAIRFKSTVANGFVRAWYDQSVTDQGGSTATGNHATQTTPDNQPKVVNNGSLVEGGIDFDGTNDSLVLSSALGITSTMGAYVVTNTSGANSAGIIFDNRDGGNEGFAIRMNSSTQIQFDYDAADVIISEGSIQSIYFANKSSSASGFALNGASLTTTSTSDTIDISNVPKIGTRSFTSDTNFYDKPIAEIVVFTGDQTDNRGAFEANVGDRYNISGMPTQENIVNGFVETWYDQSGNGKHLTQTTADKQPKIVDEGSLVTLSGKPSIKPDGTNDFLINQDSIWDTISNSALSCFTVTEKSSVTNKQLWAIGSTTDNDGDWLIGGASTAGNVQFRGARINSNIVNTGTSGTMLLTAFDVTDGDAFINGAAMGASNNPSGPTATADRLVLFARRAGDSFTTQRISEAIFYDNDQASNRVDIETNMNNFYTIF